MNPRFDLHEALSAADNDSDLLRTLIELYFDQLPSLVSEIESGLANQASESVQRNAHSLKGAIGVFGQHPAKEAARTLERFGRDAQWPEAESAWHNLQNLLTNVEQDLRELEARLADEDANPQSPQPSGNVSSAGLHPAFQRSVGRERQP